jgi:hypothetical protein
LSKDYVQSVNTVAIVKVNRIDIAQGMVLTVATQKIFKGNIIDELEASEAEIDFKIGREYLVYINGNRVLRCSRTMALNEAGSDIEFLNLNLKCIDSTLISPNSVCHRVYDPVCGCDNRTYGNRCEARQHGVSIYTIGTCK